MWQNMGKNIGSGGVVQITKSDAQDQFESYI